MRVTNYVVRVTAGECGELVCGLFDCGVQISDFGLSKANLRRWVHCGGLKERILSRFMN